MSQQHNRRRLRLGGEKRDFVLNRPSAHDFAMIEELSFARREAQAEADAAYERWNRNNGGDAYVVYRAAQDRADAAQDQLARWVRRVAA